MTDGIPHGSLPTYTSSVDFVSYTAEKEKRNSARSHLLPDSPCTSVYSYQGIKYDNGHKNKVFYMYDCIPNLVLVFTDVCSPAFALKKKNEICFVKTLLYQVQSLHFVTA